MIDTAIMDLYVLPASAGMIPSPNPIGRTCSGAPRIRGDDPDAYDDGSHDGLCSPHPRG